jgi:osmotically-inducible protein OsmY
MLPSHKVITLTLAFAFGICAAASRIQAQDLKTEVVPGDSGKSAAQSDQPKEIVKHSSVSLDKDSASFVDHHHYNSDAQRASDDLLITEVKSALLEDGISKDYPVEVDADHGTVTLSGVVASADDVKAAAEDAADVQGIVAVRNLLKPH